MSEILTMQATIKGLANARNGEVIGKAFGFAGIVCTDCHYPQNAADFNSWLRTHVSDKIGLHRAKKRREHHERAGFCNQTKRVWHQYDPCSVCNEYGNEILKLERESGISRSFLEETWPCVECIKRYNPTDRIRHIGQNNPELKGFLNVRFE